MTAQYITWRKASHSEANGNCVEVAHADGTVGVRDSKTQHGPILEFTRTEWTTFIQSVRSGGGDPDRAAGRDRR
jgi:hypothetical protein